ncbi:hypothetical protein A2U01_0085505, partial [Trifolium medium]|nr:hypothetical protein [Trifolium medium]
MAAGLVAAEDP